MTHGCLQGSKAYQLSHLAKRTDVFYPSVWVNQSSAAEGLWLPTHWVRTRFTPMDAAAASLRLGITVRLQPHC